MHTKTVFVAAVLSQALPAFGVVQEKLAALPAGWSEVAVPDDSTTMTLSIGLAQQNLDQLELKLQAISTPGNAAYGQHLTHDEVSNFLSWSLLLPGSSYKEISQGL